MLKKLVCSIFECHINSEIITSVDILVVDNDGNRSAEAVALELNHKCPNLFFFHYHNFPKKGLALVRNEILEKALEYNPNFIVFIDDDEYVTPNWLMEMVTTIEKNTADMVLGPVIPIFEEKVPVSLAKWFERVKIKDQTKMTDPGGAGNLIIRTSYINRQKCRFDIRFNTLGAEDTYFMVQALKKNAKMYWAANAIVFEHIPKDRGTLNWLLKRRYRVANTYTYIQIIERNYLGILKKFLLSLVYVVLGICALILLPFNTGNRYYGLLKMADGLGGFGGILNIKYHEYIKPN